MLPSKPCFLIVRPTLLFVACALVFAFAPSGHLWAQSASQTYAQGVEAYNRGDADGARQKFKLALEIDRNFRPAVGMLNRMAAEKKQAASPTLAKTLDRTPLSVEFSNTTLTSALEFIRSKVAEDSGNKLLLNFAVNLPPELANKKVTLKMDGVPVLEVLRYMGELTGVRFEKQQYAIMVTPALEKAAAPTPVGASTATAGR